MAASLSFSHTWLSGTWGFSVCGKYKIFPYTHIIYSWRKPQKGFLRSFINTQTMLYNIVGRCMLDERQQRRRRRRRRRNEIAHFISFRWAYSTVHFSSCKLITKQTHILLRLAINFTLVLTQPNWCLWIFPYTYTFYFTLFLCLCLRLHVRHIILLRLFLGRPQFAFMTLSATDTHTHIQYTKATQWK